MFFCMDNFAAPDRLGISIQHNGPDGATVSLVARGRHCAGRHEVTAETIEGRKWETGSRAERSSYVMAAILRQVSAISQVCGRNLLLPQAEQRHFESAFALLEEADY